MALTESAFKIDAEWAAPFRFQVKKMRRAKRLTMRIYKGQIVKVTLPSRVSLKEALQFIESQSDWIIQKSQKVESQLVDRKISFEDQSFIPYLGEQICINYCVSNHPAEPVLHGKTLTVFLSEKEVTSESVAKKRILNWYKKMAFIKASESAQLYAARLGRIPKSIRLKNYRSRWGACSSAGDLIFNWQIITFGPAMFDYVVAHEVCHLFEMNHSVRFYALLDQLGFNKKNMRQLFKSAAPIV